MKNRYKKSDSASQQRVTNKFIKLGELYHMNKKIENLIEELKKECDKENIGLSLSLVNEETFGMIAAGPANLAVMGALLQGKEYIEIAAGNCHCEECKKIRKVINAVDDEVSSTQHTFVINNKEDFADVMTRIFKGEFQ